MGYFPKWTLASTATVLPGERLPIRAAIPMGIQHLIAMSGSTILGPLLMGFDPNLAVLFSGIGTLIFFVCTAGRVPSCLGSSFSFIAVVIAVSGYQGTGPNLNIGPALGGVIAAGALYAFLGVVATLIGTRWIERLMPPVVTGAVGTAIGLNLAPVAVKGIQGSAPHILVALTTLLCVAVVSTFGFTAVKRISILIGIAVGYALVSVLGNVFLLLPPIDFGDLTNAPWLGIPAFRAPSFDLPAILLIAPVALILVAENLGHIKAVGAMTGQDLDRYIGRAFLGDGLATMLSGAGGGTGVTTYVENMGVMAVTRVFSTQIFVFAALMAILLGFSPKFGALLRTIPAPVLGGLAVAVFGLIAAAMVRLWVDHKVDFSQPRNLFTVGITLIFGSGNFSFSVGSFAVGGIGTATLAAICIHLILGGAKDRPSAEPVDNLGIRARTDRSVTT
jgi:uracil-xanthine permease